MKALSEREATWTRNTRDLMIALLLFVAIGLTTRNYVVRELLVFIAALVALFVVLFLIADLFVLFQEVWKRASTWTRTRLERISVCRRWYL
jgi:membrane protein YdbS with pleckstrin-like domain